MTLLEEWQKKKTWKNQYLLAPYYKDEKGNVDIDLAAMIKKQDELTLNPEKTSGFNEIQNFKPNCPFKFGEVEFNLDDLDVLLGVLIETLKIHLRNVWNPNDFHLIFHSGGSDSRIMSRLLMDMRDEGFDLGEFLFLCHKDEIPIFKKAMKEQGWNKEQYCGYKEDQIHEIDYYSWGTFEYNINACLSPRMDFYTEVLQERGLKSADVCLMTGVINDVLFMYPSAVGKSKYTEHWGYKELDFEIFKDYTTHYSPYYLNNLSNWKDVIYPFINFDYLDICFQIPSKFFIREPGFNDTNNFTTDIIRAGILRALGNKTPVVCERHKYNYEFSDKARLEIDNNWVKSKLYGDFPEVRDYRPDKEMPNQLCLDTKLYGLATCYERT